MYAENEDQPMLAKASASYVTEGPNETAPVVKTQMEIQNLTNEIHSAITELEKRSDHFLSPASDNAAPGVESYGASKLSGILSEHKNELLSILRRIRNYSDRLEV